MLIELGKHIFGPMSVPTGVKWDTMPYYNWGYYWDTPGLTRTVPVNPARIVPVSPGLTSHEKYDLACAHGTASSI